MSDGLFFLDETSQLYNCFPGHEGCAMFGIFNLGVIFLSTDESLLLSEA